MGFDLGAQTGWQLFSKPLKIRKSPTELRTRRSLNKYHPWLFGLALVMKDDHPICSIDREVETAPQGAIAIQPTTGVCQKR